jgi:acyl transferase domain-containing protein
MGEPVFESPVPEEEPPVEPAFSSSQSAIMERQQQLADQMHALEASRLAEQRRAAQTLAAVKTAAESEGGLLAGSRGDLLADLRDSRSLRRAFVLREVLGAPVGLR